MTNFTVQARVSGTQAVVMVSGDLDGARAPVLRKKLMEVIAGGVERLVLDLRRVTYVESVALGVIIAARRRVGGADRSVCIVLRPDQTSIRNVFTVTGLDQVFPVHETVESAEEDCGAASPAA